MAVDTISGLDAIELAGRRQRAGAGRRLWAAAWPKLLAIGLVGLVWQLVVWSGWKDPWVLPPPADVLGELGRAARTGHFWQALATTLWRGIVGFGAAVAIGAGVGLAVARSRVLRAGIGSMITGLQTMPSIAWFPLAIMLFQLTEQAILFVVVLGAAPSIANGVLAGFDYVPPLLLRAGRNIGARGASLYRHVIAPAALPAIVAGLKQGWAFAWRSLMAGELLVVIANRPALGTQLEILRGLNDAVGVIATMVVIFVLGVLVDAVFGQVDRAVRRRWGLLDTA
jgi:NitT/TauT family transport system permease protein